jgi:hypothetical protein
MTTVEEWLQEEVLVVSDTKSVYSHWRWCWMAIAFSFVIPSVARACPDLAEGNLYARHKVWCEHRPSG